MNTSNSHSNQKSKAWNTLTGIANSVSKMRNRAEAHGKTIGETWGITNQESLGLSKQFSEAVSLAKQYGRAIQKSLGQSQSYGYTRGTMHSVGESLSRSIQRALQQGESLALAVTKGYGVNMNETISKGISEGKQYSFTTNVGLSLAISWKLVYYSMEEERRLYAQMLRSLPPRTFYLSIGEENPVKVITSACYDLPSQFANYDFFNILSEYYFNLPKGTGFSLFPTKFPVKAVEEVKIYSSLPDDFIHILPQSRFQK